MPSKETSTFPRLNGLKGPGRPSKRTEKVIVELMDAISAGAPFGLACQAAGIHYDTFCDWRRRDPAFALQVDQAAARGTVKRLKKIEAQGDDGNWNALAWMIERRYPAEFSKPEIQIGIQNNVNTGGINGNTLETMVVSDLEFLGLRQREGYEHRPHDVREIETQVVPVDLSGMLVIKNAEGAVISESQAAENQRRVEQADRTIEALLTTRHQGAKNGAPSLPATPTEMKLTPIVLAAGSEPTLAFWAQLVSGDSQRQMEKATAITVVRKVLGELFGVVRAKGIPVEFKSEAVTLSDLYASLEILCAGQAGWQTLLRLAGGG